MSENDTTTNSATGANPALVELHSTVEALHTDLATNLAAAGIPASAEEDSASLVAKASAASNLRTPAAVVSAPPNFADHALAAFEHGVALALAAFARLHLPAKFLPAATAAIALGQDFLEHQTRQTEVKDAIDAATVAAGAINPVAGAAVAMAAPIVESIADDLLAGNEPVVPEVPAAQPVASAPADAAPVESVPVTPVAPVATWET